MEKVKKFRKTTDLFFSGEKFRMTRTNHLFEARAKDKQRDQYINEDRYKKIITMALQNGLKSFRAKGGVVVVIANSNKKNHSCTSILVCLDSNNNIFIITAIQCYGAGKWYRGFMKAKHRIIINPRTYILEKMTNEELKEKETEKIFLHKDKSTVKDQNVFMSYISKNKNIRRLS